jgi:hypothetical protein
MSALTYRQQAEAIEQFGDDVLKALRALERSGIDPAVWDRWNDIPNVGDLDLIVTAIRDLGVEMSREVRQGRRGRGPPPRQPS